jgi:hypothetical protein
MITFLQRIIYFKYKNIKIINFDALYYCANEKENIKHEIRQDVNRYTFIILAMVDIDDFTIIMITRCNIFIYLKNKYVFKLNF